MKLNINTTSKKAYRQVLEIVRSIPPLTSLRNRELDLLAILMYYNAKYRDVQQDLRLRIILDTSTKRDMQKEIKMSEDAFNNNLSLMRRSGVLNKDGSLPSFLQIMINDKYEILFNFNIIDKDEV